jgi:hypothetical protein
MGGLFLSIFFNIDKFMRYDFVDMKTFFQKIKIKNGIANE